MKLFIISMLGLIANLNSERNADISGAGDYVHIECRSESCMQCAHTHISYLHNTHNTQMIIVKYEKVDGKGKRISTGWVNIDAMEVEQLGSNGSTSIDSKAPYKYRILSAAYAG